MAQVMHMMLEGCASWPGYAMSYAMNIPGTTGAAKTLINLQKNLSPFAQDDAR